MTFIARGVLSAIALVCTVPSNAQPAEPPKPQDKDSGNQQPASLNKVEVNAPNAAQERSLSTTTKIVVDREEIGRFADRTLAEVLKRLPSVTVTTTSSGNEIRMRGLGSGYTRVLINGSPTSPGFSIDSLPADQIERIEIIRAASAELGAQSIAGTINVILKQSVQRTQTEIKVSATDESSRPALGISGQLSERFGGFSYSVSAAIDRRKIQNLTYITDRGATAEGVTNLFRTGTQDHNYTVDAISITPRVGWNFDQDKFSADAVLSRRKTTGSQVERSQTFIGEPLTYANSDLVLENPVTMLRGNVKWERALESGASITSNFGTVFDRRFSEAQLKGFDQLGVFNLERRVTSNASDRSFTLSGKYSAPYAEKHDLAIGWDVSYAQRAEDRIQRDSSPVGIEPINIDEDYDARVLRLALFAQDEWKVSQQLSAYLGIRWEGLQTSSVGNVLAEVRNTSSVVSPVFQGVWQVSKSDRIRLALSRTYKAPGTAQLMPRRFVAKNNSPITPNTQGNPDLKPELAWGLDAAYERSIGSKGVASVAVYARRIDDVIRQNLFEQNGIWITRPINGGRADVYGVELDWKSPLPWLSDTVTLQANISGNWSSVKDVAGPDNRLDQQVPLSTNIGLQHTRAGSAVSFGANISYQRGARVQLSSTQVVRFGSVRALDVYAVWKLDKHVSLRFTAANLWNMKRTGQTGYADETRVLTQDTARDLDTQARVTLEMRF